jgi:tetracycline repressor-like protein
MLFATCSSWSLGGLPAPHGRLRRRASGGCFFVAASAELGARRGPLHDLVARYQQEWRDLLENEAREAQARGELLDDLDPAQLAFEVGVILAGTNVVAVLHGDDTAVERARRAVSQRLAP